MLEIQMYERQILIAENMKDLKTLTLVNKISYDTIKEAVIDLRDAGKREYLIGDKKFEVVVLYVNATGPQDTCVVTSDFYKELLKDTPVVVKEYSAQGTLIDNDDYRIAVIKDQERRHEQDVILAKRKIKTLKATIKGLQEFIKTPFSPKFRRKETQRITFPITEADLSVYRVDEDKVIKSVLKEQEMNLKKALEAKIK